METSYQAAVIALLGGLSIAVLSGCGMTYGQLTVGTTGFLEEVNKRPVTAPVDKVRLSDKDRRQLSALIASKTNTPNN